MSNKTNKYIPKFYTKTPNPPAPMTRDEQFVAKLIKEGKWAQDRLSGYSARAFTTQFIQKLARESVVNSGYGGWSPGSTLTREEIAVLRDGYITNTLNASLFCHELVLTPSELRKGLTRTAWLNLLNMTISEVKHFVALLADMYRYNAYINNKSENTILHVLNLALLLPKDQGPTFLFSMTSSRVLNDTYVTTIMNLARKSAAKRSTDSESTFTDGFGNQSIHRLTDLITMAEQLGLPFDPKWSFSRISKTHDKYAKIQRLVTRKQDLAKYRKRFYKPAFIALAKRFELGEYHAELLETATAYLDEGETMSHCIFSYAKWAQDKKYVAYRLFHKGKHMGSLGVKYGVVFSHEPGFPAPAIKLDFDQMYGYGDSIITNPDLTALAKVITEGLNSIDVDLFRTVKVLRDLKDAEASVRHTKLIAENYKSRENREVQFSGYRNSNITTPELTNLVDEARESLARYFALL